MAERFVTENLTLDARDALEKGMVDMIADDLPHLLELLQGHALTIQGQELILDTGSARITKVEMTP